MQTKTRLTRSVFGKPVTTRCSAISAAFLLVFVSGCATDPMHVYNVERAPQRSWDPSAKGTARSEAEAVNRSVHRELDAKDPSSPMQAAKAFVGAAYPGQVPNSR